MKKKFRSAEIYNTNNTIIRYLMKYLTYIFSFDTSIVINLLIF